MTDVILGEWQCPRRREAVPDARHHVRKLAASHYGYGDTGEQVEQAVSEVLANAVQHGSGTDMSIRVTAKTSAVRVEVRDDGCTSLPRGSQLADINAECGRGLWLVGFFARAWGLESDATGTLAWFEVTAPEAVNHGRTTPTR